MMKQSNLPIRGFLFPGHGTQEPGMGQSILAHSPLFNNCINELDEARMFSFSCRELISDPSGLLLEDEIKGQIAVFLVNAGYDMALKSKDVLPAVTYGYSSGVYSAIYCSNACTLLEGVQMVKKAGEIIRKRTLQMESQMGMLSVTGLQKEKLLALMENLDLAKTIEIANCNSQRQFYLSGFRDALTKLTTMKKIPGLISAVFLQASMPYHSTLLKEAASEFGHWLQKNIAFKTPSIPVIDGHSGKLLHHKEQLVNYVKNQFALSVQLPKVAMSLKQLGTTELWETGWGKFIQKQMRWYKELPPVKSAVHWVTEGEPEKL